MHRDVPTAGKSMLFPEWSGAIVAGLRKLIPDVAVTKKGVREVIIRHAGRVARLTDDGTFWVRFDEGDGVPMASLYDAERRDAFTCSNFARSIAGYFDGKFAHSRNE